jgi:hypothetical protein
LLNEKYVSSYVDFAFIKNNGFKYIIKIAEFLIDLSLCLENDKNENGQYLIFCLLIKNLWNVVSSFVGKIFTTNFNTNSNYSFSIFIITQGIYSIDEYTSIFNMRIINMYNKLIKKYSLKTISRIAPTLLEMITICMNNSLTIWRGLIISRHCLSNKNLFSTNKEKNNNKIFNTVKINSTIEANNNHTEQEDLKDKSVKNSEDIFNKNIKSNTEEELSNDPEFNYYLDAILKSFKKIVDKKSIIKASMKHSLLKILSILQYLNSNKDLTQNNYKKEFLNLLEDKKYKSLEENIYKIFIETATKSYLDSTVNFEQENFFDIEDFEDEYKNSKNKAFDQFKLIQEMDIFSKSKVVESQNDYLLNSSDYSIYERMFDLKFIVNKMIKRSCTLYFKYELIFKEFNKLFQNEEGCYSDSFNFSNDISKFIRRLNLSYKIRENFIIKNELNNFITKPNIDALFNIGIGNEINNKFDDELNKYDNYANKPGAINDLNENKTITKSVSFSNVNNNKDDNKQSLHKQNSSFNIIKTKLLDDILSKVNSEMLIPYLKELLIHERENLIDILSIEPKSIDCKLEDKDYFKNLNIVRSILKYSELMNFIINKNRSQAFNVYDTLNYKDVLNLIKDLRIFERCNNNIVTIINTVEMHLKKIKTEISKLKNIKFKNRSHNFIGQDHLLELILANPTIEIIMDKLNSSSKLGKVNKKSNKKRRSKIIKEISKTNLFSLEKDILKRSIEKIYTKHKEFLDLIQKTLLEVTTNFCFFIEFLKFYKQNISIDLNDKEKVINVFNNNDEIEIEKVGKKFIDCFNSLIDVHSNSNISFESRIKITSDSIKKSNRNDSKDMTDEESYLKNKFIKDKYSKKKVQNKAILNQRVKSKKTCLSLSSKTNRNILSLYSEKFKFNNEILNESIIMIYLNSFTNLFSIESISKAYFVSSSDLFKKVLQLKSEFIYKSNFNNNSSIRGKVYLDEIFRNFIFSLYDEDSYDEYLSNIIQFIFAFNNHSKSQSILDKVIEEKLNKQQNKSLKNDLLNEIEKEKSKTIEEKNNKKKQEIEQKSPKVQMITKSTCSLNMVINFNCFFKIIQPFLDKNIEKSIRVINKMCKIYEDPKLSVVKKKEQKEKCYLIEIKEDFIPNITDLVSQFSSKFNFEGISDHINKGTIRNRSELISSLQNFSFSDNIREEEYVKKVRALLSKNFKIDIESYVKQFSTIQRKVINNLLKRIYEELLYQNQKIDEKLTYEFDNEYSSKIYAKDNSDVIITNSCTRKTTCKEKEEVMKSQENIHSFFNLDSLIMTLGSVIRSYPKVIYMLHKFQVNICSTKYKNKKDQNIKKIYFIDFLTSHYSLVSNFFTTCWYDMINHKNYSNSVIEKDIEYPFSENPYKFNTTFSIGFEPNNRLSIFEGIRNTSLLTGLFQSLCFIRRQQCLNMESFELSENFDREIDNSNLKELKISHIEILQKKTLERVLRQIYISLIEINKILEENNLHLDLVNNLEKDLRQNHNFKSEKSNVDEKLTEDFKSKNKYALEKEFNIKKFEVKNILKNKILYLIKFKSIIMCLISLIFPQQNMIYHQLASFEVVKTLFNKNKFINYIDKEKCSMSHNSNESNSIIHIIVVLLKKLNPIDRVECSIHHLGIYFLNHINGYLDFNYINATKASNLKQSSHINDDLINKIIGNNVENPEIIDLIVEKGNKIFIKNSSVTMKDFLANNEYANNQPNNINTMDIEEDNLDSRKNNEITLKEPEKIDENEEKDEFIENIENKSSSDDEYLSESNHDNISGNQNPDDSNSQFYFSLSNDNDSNNEVEEFEEYSESSEEETDENVIEEGVEDYNNEDNDLNLNNENRYRNENSSVPRERGDSLIELVGEEILESLEANTTNTNNRRNNRLRRRRSVNNIIDSYENVDERRGGEILNIEVDEDENIEDELNDMVDELGVYGDFSLNRPFNHRSRSQSRRRPSISNNLSRSRQSSILENQDRSYRISVELNSNDNYDDLEREIASDLRRIRELDDDHELLDDEEYIDEEEEEEDDNIDPEDEDSVNLEENNEDDNKENDNYINDQENYENANQNLENNGINEVDEDDFQEDEEEENEDEENEDDEDADDDENNLDSFNENEDEEEHSHDERVSNYMDIENEHSSDSFLDGEGRRIDTLVRNANSRRNGIFVDRSRRMNLDNDLAFTVMIQNPNNNSYSRSFGERRFLDNYMSDISNIRRANRLNSNNPNLFLVSNNISFPISRNNNPPPFINEIPSLSRSRADIIRRNNYSGDPQNNNDQINSFYNNIDIDRIQFSNQNNLTNDRNILNRMNLNRINQLNANIISRNNDSSNQRVYSIMDDFISNTFFERRFQPNRMLDNETNNGFQTLQNDLEAIFNCSIKDENILSSHSEDFMDDVLFNFEQYNNKLVTMKMFQNIHNTKLIPIIYETDLDDLYRPQISFSMITKIPKNYVLKNFQLCQYLYIHPFNRKEENPIYRFEDGLFKNSLLVSQIKTVMFTCKEKSINNMLKELSIVDKEYIEYKTFNISSLMSEFDSHLTIKDKILKCICKEEIVFNNNDNNSEGTTKAMKNGLNKNSFNPLNKKMLNKKRAKNELDLTSLLDNKGSKNLLLNTLNTNSIEKETAINEENNTSLNLNSGTNDKEKEKESKTLADSTAGNIISSNQENTVNNANLSNEEPLRRRFLVRNRESRTNNRRSRLNFNTSHSRNNLETTGDRPSSNIENSNNNSGQRNNNFDLNNIISNIIIGRSSEKVFKNLEIEMCESGLSFNVNLKSDDESIHRENNNKSNENSQININVIDSNINNNIKDILFGNSEIKTSNPNVVKNENSSSNITNVKVSATINKSSFVTSSTVIREIEFEIVNKEFKLISERIPIKADINISDNINNINNNLNTNNQTRIQENNRDNLNDSRSASEIDPEYLNALPEELREEAIMNFNMIKMAKRQVRRQRERINSFSGANNVNSTNNNTANNANNNLLDLLYTGNAMRDNVFNIFSNDQDDMGYDDEDMFDLPPLNNIPVQLPPISSTYNRNNRNLNNDREENIEENPEDHNNNVYNIDPPFSRNQRRFGNPFSFLLGSINRHGHPERRNLKNSNTFNNEFSIPKFKYDFSYLKDLPCNKQNFKSLSLEFISLISNFGKANYSNCVCLNGNCKDKKDYLNEEKDLDEFLENLFIFNMKFTCVNTNWKITSNPYWLFISAIMSVSEVKLKFYDIMIVIWILDSYNIEKFSLAKKDFFKYHLLSSQSTSNLSSNVTHTINLSYTKEKYLQSNSLLKKLKMVLDDTQALQEFFYEDFTENVINSFKFDSYTIKELFLNMNINIQNGLFSNLLNSSGNNINVKDILCYRFADYVKKSNQQQECEIKKYYSTKNSSMLKNYLIWTIVYNHHNNEISNYKMFQNQSFANLTLDENILSIILRLMLKSTSSEIKKIYTLGMFQSLTKELISFKDQSLNISKKTINCILDLYFDFETCLMVQKEKRTNDPSSLIIQIISDYKTFKTIITCISEKIMKLIPQVLENLTNFKNKGSYFSHEALLKPFPEIVMFRIIKLINKISNSLHFNKKQKRDSNEEENGFNFFFNDVIENNNNININNNEIINEEEDKVEGEKAKEKNKQKISALEKTKIDMSELIKSLNTNLFDVYKQFDNLLLSFSINIKDDQKMIDPRLDRLVPYIEAFIIMSHLQFFYSHDLQVQHSTTNNNNSKFLIKQSYNNSKTPEETPIIDFFSINKKDYFVEFFLKFCTNNKKIINLMLRRFPKMFPTELILKISKFLDLKNKKKYFKMELKKLKPQSIETQSITVRRNSLLESSFNKLKFTKGEQLRNKLTIKFQGEEAVDAGGVKREWFTLLSKEIFNPNFMYFKLAGNGVTYIPNENSGYFNDSTIDHIDFFRFVGKVIGKAIYDGFLLECHFTRAIYKLINNTPLTFQDMEDYDVEHYKSLKWLLDTDISGVDYGFTFSYNENRFGKVETKELIPNGENIEVTEENKFEYIQKISEAKLYLCVKPQIDAFLEGIYGVIPQKMLSIFNHRELELMISGLPTIDVFDWKANTIYEYYSANSSIIVWFWEIIQSFDQTEQAEVLQFVTGSSQVPLEGFSVLQGIGGINKFKIVKNFDKNIDRLPTAHTCTNQLDLPEYPSKEILHERLMTAMREGKGFGFI